MKTFWSVISLFSKKYFLLSRSSIIVRKTTFSPKLFQFVGQDVEEGREESSEEDAG